MLKMIRKLLGCNQKCCQKQPESTFKVEIADGFLKNLNGENLNVQATQLDRDEMMFSFKTENKTKTLFVKMVKVKNVKTLVTEVLED